MFTLILLFLFFLGTSYVGYRYVKEGVKQNNNLMKRRENAKKICPINDAPGVSLDKRNIYALTPEELGL